MLMSSAGRSRIRYAFFRTVFSFQTASHLLQCSVIFRQDGGERQLQQRRDLPVLHTRDRVEQHDAPLLVAKACQRVLQEDALVRIQSALLRGNGVPFLLAEGGMAFLAPQTHQAQAAAHGQQPSHRRSAGAVLRRAVPHLHIDVLCEILRILRVFEVGQRKAVHRRARAPVQLRQGVTVTTGNAEKRLLQLVPILCRHIFGCHQHTEHGLFLLSSV